MKSMRADDRGVRGLGLDNAERRRLAYLVRYHKGRVPAVWEDGILDRDEDDGVGLRVVLGLLRAADGLDSRSMGGPQLVVKVRGAVPGERVLVIDGYVRDAEEAAEVYGRRKKYRLLEETVGWRWSRSGLAGSGWRRWRRGERWQGYGFRLAVPGKATIGLMKAILAQLIHGTALTFAQAEAAFTDIMEGTADPVQTASLLSLLAAREPTVEELQGATTVMRRHVIAIDAPENVIDTCRTGGTGSQVFNISTTVALVAAAAGVPVCKHGNRSVTSRSGSSDVLRVLGVNIEMTPEQKARCLREAGCVLGLPRDIIPRCGTWCRSGRRWGFRRSLICWGLWPIRRGAGQVVGTGGRGAADKLLEVLVRLGAARAIVVSGSDPQMGALCDISVTGPTHVADYDGVLEDGSDGGTNGGGKRRYSIVPEDLGLRTHEHSDELVIRSPEDSARLMRGILARQVGGQRGTSCWRTRRRHVGGRGGGDSEGRRGAGGGGAGFGARSGRWRGWRCAATRRREGQSGCTRSTGLAVVMMAKILRIGRIHRRGTRQ